MAQRFGGKYSPQGKSVEAVEVTPIRPRDTEIGPGWKANTAFVLPFLFLARAFSGGPTTLALFLGAGGLLLLAAWLTRDGVRAQAAYDARRVARRPALPRKLAGSLLTGLGFVAGGLGTGATLPVALLLGAIAAALHFGAFGADPLRDKGMEGIDPFQTDRVARALAEAETTLAAMKDAILRAKDRNLEARVDRFATSARALFQAVEGDPGDLTAARKYLTVYLTGARDATVKFADHWAQTRDAKARADYESLLTELETTFADRSRALLSNAATDLDVEISVLRDRLKFET